MRVAIIGGGYAGLAAGVTLAEQGIPTTLFEAGKQLGGRARGIAWRGLKLDNGQHILLGAYRETMRLMALTGVDTGAARRQRLQLAIPGRFELNTPSLPAPLHLIAGLLAARGLDVAERLGALRFAVAMRLQGFRLGRDESVSTLLARYRQDGVIGRLLWEPLCLAALNTPPSRASAQIFLNVLRDSFSHARSDSDMILPTVDLTQLFPASAAAYLHAHGGELLVNARIRRIEPGKGKFLLSWDESKATFSHVICATAPQHALPLLADRPGVERACELIAAFSYQPIATIYLQYPRSIRLPGPMLGLDGKHGQWVFDRGWTHGTPGLLAVVISAEGGYRDLPPQQLAGEIAAELQQRFKLPPPQWHKTIIEKRATFSCDVDVGRPTQATGLENFYLAGDYTAGEYPATIEGAVRSGVKCAKLICETP